MYKLLFSGSIIAILLSACSKSNDVVAPTTPNYQNMKAGSIWNYEKVDHINSTTSLYSVTSTNRDTSIFSASYHVFTNSAGPNEYRRVSNETDYYTFANLPEAIVADTKVNLYLITAQDKFFTWSQNYGITFGGIQQTLTLTNTIADKGISKTVNGVVYNDVIYVTSTYSIAGLPAGIITTDIKSYYAPNYGLIENSRIVTVNIVGVPSSGNENSTTTLKTATLL